MQKFIKNRIEVQAVQYDGLPESLEELTSLGLQYKIGEDSSISIVTSHGETTGEIGDYILMSVTGDFEICNQDKFQKLYSAENNYDIQEQSPETSKKEVEKSYESSETEEKQLVFQPVQTEKKTGVLELLQLIFLVLQLVIIVTVPLITNSMVKKNIKTTVEFIYQEDIKKESDLLLEKTKAEALLIIEQAKKDAVIEADESFRKEMERLTNERVKK